MPLGTDVGLGSSHIVLDETQLPQRKGAQQPPLHFSAHVCRCGETVAHLSNCALVTCMVCYM